MIAKPKLTYAPWMTTAGGRKFLLVVWLTLSNEILVWAGKISGEVYATIIIGCVAAYIAGNVIKAKGAE